MDVMYEIPSDDSIAECILTKKSVDGEEKPLVRYRTDYCRLNNKSSALALDFTTIRG